MRAGLVLAALAATSVLAASAHATTVRGFTARGLTHEAAAVVRGTVVSQSGVWNADKSRIYTESKLRVTEVVAGKLKARHITVRQIGGTVDGVTMFVTGVARIPVGQDVLLFLRTDGVRYYLVGMAQGKYRIIKEKSGREVVTRELEGLNIRAKVPVQPAAREGYKEFTAKVRAYALEKTR